MFLGQDSGILGVGAPEIVSFVLCMVYMVIYVAVFCEVVCYR